MMRCDVALEHVASGAFQCSRRTAFDASRSSSKVRNWSKSGSSIICQMTYKAVRAITHADRSSCLDIKQKKVLPKGKLRQRR